MSERVNPNSVINNPGHMTDVVCLVCSVGGEKNARDLKGKVSNSEHAIKSTSHLLTYIIIMSAI